MIPKKGSALPVRLTDEEKSMLNQIAESTGLTVSTIIRLLVDALIRDCFKNGIHLSLPLSISRLLASPQKGE